MPTPPGPTSVTQPHSGPGEQRADLGQLALAADRRVRRRRQRRGEHGAGPLGHQLGIVGEDHALERRSSGPGSSPSSSTSSSAALAHHLERVRLAAGAVEREHQLRAQPLAQRVLGDERPQLADQVGGAPAASSAASRSSIASRRSSSRRAISLWANSSTR